MKDFKNILDKIIVSNEELIEKGIEDWNYDDTLGYAFDGYINLFDEKLYNMEKERGEGKLTRKEIIEYYKGENEMGIYGFAKPFTGYLYGTYDVDEEEEDDIEKFGNVAFYQYYQDGFADGFKVCFDEEGNVIFLMQFIGGSDLGLRIEWWNKDQIEYYGYKMQRIELFRRWDKKGNIIDEKLKMTQEEKEIAKSIIIDYTKTSAEEEVRKYCEESLQHWIKINAKHYPYYEKHPEKLREDFYYLVKPIGDRIIDARANGVFIDLDIPEFFPEDFEIPNPIRKSMKNKKYFKKLD